MRHKIYLPFFLTILILNLSCKKDFLVVEDNSSILRQIHVKDLKTTKEYLNGIYLLFSQDFFYGYNQIYPELIADNIKPLAGDLTMHYNWSQISEDIFGQGSKSMTGIWLYGYQIARACNFVVEKADEYKNADLKKSSELKAQALALRAYTYFIIVNVYAQSYNFTPDGSHPGIPYITSSDIAAPFSRQTVAEVYANIISDLNNAIPLFNDDPVNILHMNRNAANAMLSRVLLFKGDFQQAKNIARSVIAEVPLMTGSDYPTKLFTQQETEALFQLPPSWGGVDNASYSAYLQGVFLAPPLYFFTASADIASILKENPQDVRNNWVVDDGSGLWTVAKYPQDVVSGFPAGTLSYYQTLLRSSEMYLTAAESYAKLGSGFEDSAKFYLDVIRLRANPAAPPTTATGAALLDSVFKERRKELAFEGLRMFDLLRWKKGVERTDPLSPDAKSLPYPSNKAIAPIPLKDVNLGGIPQNPGY